MLVTCKDIVGRIDAVGSSVTTVIHFRFYKDKDCIGGVAVHLHHSTRLIQVQGKSVLPDKSHAPVWFVEQYLKSKFSTLAATKSTEISSMNQTVQDMLGSSLQVPSKASCAGCRVPFNGRSAPEFCSSCSKYFHRSKCFPTSTHPCYSAGRSRSNSTSTTSVTRASIQPINAPHSVVTIPDVSSIQTVASSVTSLLVTTPAVSQPLVISTAMSPTTQAFPVPSTHQASISLPPPPPVQAQSVPTPQPNVLSSPGDAPADDPLPPLRYLDPLAPPFTSNQVIHTQQQASAPPRQTGARKKVKQVPATDPMGIELELTKYALNTAKTKICEQDTDLKDLRFRNKILEDRIAILEKREKQGIADSYSSPVSQGPLRAPCYRHTYCCHAPPTCCGSSEGHSLLQPPANSLNSAKTNADIKRHEEILQDLKQRVESLSLIVTAAREQSLRSEEVEDIISSESSLPTPTHHVAVPGGLQESQLDPDAPSDLASQPQGENDCMDTSAASIDHEMSDAALTEVPLNSQSLTTQLAQLEQTFPQ